jgi:hypothetical protein
VWGRADDVKGHAFRLDSHSDHLREIMNMASAHACNFVSWFRDVMYMNSEESLLGNQFPGACKCTGGSHWTSKGKVGPVLN